MRTTGSNMRPSPTRVQVAHKCRYVCPGLRRWATKREGNGALVAVGCGCQQASQFTKILNDTSTVISGAVHEWGASGNVEFIVLGITSAFAYDLLGAVAS